MDTTFFTIKQLEATNIKSLESFKGDFNNMSVILFGSEEAGKTNVWQVANLLKRIPSAIVTKGKGKGEATVDISKGETNYKFQFSFTEDGKHKLTTYVDGEEKAITKARQAYIIEELIAPTLEIDKLINSTGQKQVDIIKQALNIDTVREEAFYKQMYEARTLLKRDLTNNPEPTKVDKVEEVILNDLLAEQKKITDFNLEQDTKQKVINYYLEISKKLDAAITNPNSDNYAEHIATTTNINKDIIKFITENLKKLEQPKMHKDLIAISKNISNAQYTNDNAAKYKTYLSSLGKYNELKKKVDEADIKVKDARNKLVSKMNSIEIPIDGLEFKVEMAEAGALKTELMYNGLEFSDDSVNTSKKYAIGARLQMNLFKEGNMAVFHCNASFMSESTVKELATECAALGIQCLFEVTSKKDNDKLKVESIL